MSSFTKNIEAFFIGLILFWMAPLSAHAQEYSTFGISVGTDYFSELLVHEHRYTGASTLSIELSFYDFDYTRLEYSLNHTRGYNPDISYTYGFSAAYVLPLSGSVTLKPGLGIDGFKMSDRECKSFVRSFFRNVFNTDDHCLDDVHASFMPFMKAEIRVANPLAIYLKSGYRTFLSSVHREVSAGDVSSTDNHTEQNTRLKTDHSFYGSGLGFSAGLRIDF
ncbi:hypothetical protein DYD21_17275 [Rhodohalobacter sp. SW132]|uniref:hypothetical protein n=1 Tax=Rhodohalobacter sp. SW132 TaxID=2293433 RepID=UPI000E2437A6|nr:hypothetical protein [Rhodohalobacter sp. SW132]REL24617.1 hypothetical protein DYD21_17275 [Rhodohalobacter sp. SW132]